ncbi:MAG TPA: response regulator [Methanoregula sp.]|nr:response regulator [Methanoregula sp.]
MAGQSILIVEDDGVIALRMQEMLTKSGYSVADPVAFGEDALEQIAEKHPDLVLMDIELMGEIDGIETTRLIQERFEIPVIYLTAYVDDHRLARAKETAPYGYIVKPFMDRELLATIDMAIHRHALDRKLKESERRYHAVVDKAAEYIFMVNGESRRIAEANPSFIGLLGYGPEILPTLLLPEIIIDPADPMAPIADRICSREGFSGEARIRCSDSSYRDVELASSMISAAGASPVISIVAHDVTDRKKAAEAIGQVNRKLHFLTQITRHDIANLLTVAIGYNGFMKPMVSDPAVQDYLTRQEKILDTINRQIQFTKIYDDIGAASPRWLSLQAILSEAMAHFDAALFSVPKEPVRYEIYADPLFGRVFYNLFENATRHAGDFSKITISARESPEGLVIVIEDDGKGIPADIKEKIFSRGYGTNTGLGLYLSREILDITHIAIRETGAKGSGARFEIVVPAGAYRSSVR